jgi:uncharacterized protein
MAALKPRWEKASDIVRDAGGQIIGRTKLQKIAYLLELCGWGDGFSFEYRHYGPYSEDLTDSIQTAIAFGLVNEEQRRADWGGIYSVFSLTGAGNRALRSRASFAKAAAEIGAIELELAATAAYLKSVELYDDPWEETKRRKPEKATEKRMGAAKEAYAALRNLPTPRALPRI